MVFLTTKTALAAKASASQGVNWHIRDAVAVLPDLVALN